MSLPAGPLNPYLVRAAGIYGPAAGHAVPLRCGRKTGARVLYTWTPALRAVVPKARGSRRRIGSLSLFASQDGTPYTVRGWNSAWRRLLAKSEVDDCHFHDIRAKSLTDASKIGGRDYAQALAGHADGSMTEVYIRDREFTHVRPLH
ncbi:MAG: tyrosine-type recombinase/integrase [Acidithiobacillus sp.]